MSISSINRINILFNSLINSYNENQLVLESCRQIDSNNLNDRYWINPFISKSSWVDIGGIKLNCIIPIKQPELIPFNIPLIGSVCDFDCKEIRHHLRWMMQKELLNQDMFLIGPPGPYRRWLAFMFCEFIGRPASYISLTRDTAESDLKQRREIRNNSAIYEDLLVVKAATEGHILIIEGIEKCERNVLPVLNNLLENREMLLEDGRFLVNHKRYDKLIKEGNLKDDSLLKQLNLIRAHPQFRVIALGLPVPQFPGNPMDPPLRSRFQCRDIIPSQSESHISTLIKGLKTSNNDFTEEYIIKLISNLVTLSESLQQTSENEDIQLLPHFPDTPGLLHIFQIITNYPFVNIERLLHRVYPYTLITDEAESAGIDIAIKRFLTEHYKQEQYNTINHSDFYHINSINLTDKSQQLLTIQFKYNSSYYDINIYGGLGKLNSFISTDSYLHLDYHDNILSEMIHDHSIGCDICIIGEKGIGKSALAEKFCSIIGYSPAITMHLYQDMSARDLLQRRATRSNGDTIWEITPLIHAAINGSIAILDGIDRLVPSTFSILQRLCQDRECTLFDGTQLVRNDRYKIMEEFLSKEELRIKKIIPVHPAFRIIALANQPTPINQWLTSEVIPMFHFHYLPHYSMKDTSTLLHKLYPNLSVDDYIIPLITLDNIIRNKNLDNQQIRDNIKGFTFRQLLRLCKRWSIFPLSNNEIQRFKKVTTSIDDNLTDNEINEIVDGFISGKNEISNIIPEIKITENKSNNIKELSIGNISRIINNPINPALVPHVNFYNMPAHIQILQKMLQDFIIQEPMLLIGPQGVGKNMLADRLLELLQIEREYIQLHRDTSVQSLTLSPALHDGVISWEDSPLVSAVRCGRCLVVDEADKAPLEVVCILKGLIEDGEMLLSNGKRILSAKKINQLSNNLKDSIIQIHPNFRIIVLANKQGYPFLGNDLMRELGDCFSCHIINNPDEDSELALLRFYGPDVPQDVLVKLTRLFSDLRRLVDEGLLSYPYSTRELVNIVKHLQEFPEDGLVTTIENVFSFDGYDTQLLQHLTQVFHRHGLPIGGNRLTIQLSLSFPLGKKEVIDNWKIKQINNTWDMRIHPVLIKGNWKYSTELIKNPQTLTSRKASRIKKFGEEVYQWDANNKSSISQSSSRSGRVVDICSLPNGSVHVLINDPMKIHSFDPLHKEFVEFDLVTHLRYSSMPNMTEFPFRFNLIALPNNNSIMVYIPSFEVGLLLNLETLLVTVLSLDIAEGSVALYNDIVYLGYRRQLSVNVRKEKESTIVKNEWSYHGIDRIIFYIPGQTRFKIVQFLPNSKSVGDIIEFHIPNTKIINLFPMNDGSSLLIEDSNNNIHSFSINWNNSSPTITNLRLITRQNPNIPYKLCLQFNHSMYLASNNSIHMESDSYNINNTKNLTIYHYPRDDNYKILSSICLYKSLLIIHVMVQPDLANSPIILQIIDPIKKNFRIIEIPFDIQRSSHQSRRFLARNLDDCDYPRIWIEELSDGRVCILEESGRIRIYEFLQNQLDSSLLEWKKLLGDPESRNENLSLTMEYDGTREATLPKEGKPTDGNEHHGGNTWQEGTGGADTPGLGGTGGPYRLEGSFDTFQISDEQKKKISEEAERARREMGQEMKRKKLTAIDMSEYSASEYQRYLDAVKLQIGQLRVIVESVRAKQKERAWLRHKTQGELDDMKLVDGLVGERNVYKQRGEIPPTSASFQQKPKRLHFAMDVSGSMYRFNGQDGRLDRLLETVCMIMESFSGYETKYSFSIAGHSGDGPHIPFIDYGKSPLGAKERLKVLQKMKVHTEYCASGDSTLEALRLGMKYVVEEEGDDYFVFLVSDANLSRYNISPKDLTDRMNSDKRVNCYAIFIASIADEAERLTKELPSGKSFVCLNTSTLPSVFKQIFTNSLLQDQ